MIKFTAIAFTAVISFSCSAAATIEEVEVARAPDVQDTRTPNVTSHGSLTKNNALDISVPENAGDTMSQNHLVVYMNIDVINSSEQHKISDKAKQALRVYIESQIPKLKRFSVYGVFNDSAYQMTEELQDLGEIEYVEPEQLPSPDLYLNLTMDVQTQYNTAGGVSSLGQTGDDLNDHIWYTLVTSASLQDSKRLALESESFKTTVSRSITTWYNRRTGEWEFRGGFNPKNRDSVNGVLQEVARNQLVDVALWLGKKFPVTAKLKGLSKTATKGGIDKGVKDGLLNTVEMVLWAEDFIGITYPLAACTVSAQPDKATINIVRWNNKDADAAAVIAEIINDPKITRGEGDYMFYATTYSMPLPSEWMR